MTERETWEAVTDGVSYHGNGARPSFVSLSDRDRFHGLDEACWPAPLQDVGKRLAEDGHAIARIYFSYVARAFYFEAFPHAYMLRLGVFL